MLLVHSINKVDEATELTIWLSLSYRDFFYAQIYHKPFLALVAIQRFNPVYSNIL
jgi:hypothetical protein